MMGGQSSKKKGRDNAPPPPPPPPMQTHINKMSQYKDDLVSYEEACKVDPDLQSFDATLHERTSRVIGSLATGVEVSALSFNSLKDVTDCLLDMNQEVVQVILDEKKDIWNNPDLFSLVTEYFQSSVNTLNFCAVLVNCLKRARNSRLIMQVALRQFEIETSSQEGVVEKKYTRTLEELQRFKAAGDPFTDEFFRLLHSVYKQQVTMLEKLQKQKRILDKKLKSMKTWRRVSNVLFVSAFVAVLVFSVVAAAVFAPPVVTALAGALAVPIGSIGKWCNMLWDSYEKALKGKRELLSSMWVGTFITVKDMDGLRVLVDRLEIKIDSILQNTDFAIQEGDDAVGIVIDEIKKKLDEFMKTIDDLGEHADKCSREIRMARTVILRRIVSYPEQ